MRKVAVSLNVYLIIWSQMQKWKWILYTSLVEHGKYVGREKRLESRIQKPWFGVYVIHESLDVVGIGHVATPFACNHQLACRTGILLDNEHIGTASASRNCRQQSRSSCSNYDCVKLHGNSLMVSGFYVSGFTFLVQRFWFNVQSSMGLSLIIQLSTLNFQLSTY